MFKRSLSLPLRACCANFNINFITKKLLGNKHHIPKWSAKAYTLQWTRPQLEQPFWSCGVSRRISHFHYWIYFCVFIHHKKRVLCYFKQCSLLLPNASPLRADYGLQGFSPNEPHSWRVRTGSSLPKPTNVLHSYMQHGMTTVKLSCTPWPHSFPPRHDHDGHFPKPVVTLDSKKNRAF